MRSTGISTVRAYLALQSGEVGIKWVDPRQKVLLLVEQMLHEPGKSRLA